jgi:hypothetical protein
MSSVVAILVEGAKFSDFFNIVVFSLSLNWE